MDKKLAKLVSDLVAQGAAIGVKPLGWHGVLLGHAELLPNGLFWAHAVWPLVQSDTHLLEFDKAQQNGAAKGIAFYKDNRLAAYLSPIEDWGELDYQESKATLADWRRGKDTNAILKPFVDMYRD